MQEHSGVLVVGELTQDGTLSAATGELLGAARELAAGLGGEEISAAVIGHNTRANADLMIALGVGRVYVVDSPLFGHYLNETSVQACAAIVAQAAPRIVLIGQTPDGRDLGPSLAFALNTGIAMDCLEVAIDPSTKGLRATRSVSGGLFRQVLSIQARPQIATVRQKTYDAPDPNPAATGEIISVDPGINPATVRSRVVGYAPAETEGVQLEDARIVVAGGRGIGSAEGFDELEALAGLLGGAMGATRSATDLGYCSERIMIGITGRVVAPELYLAIGLSGASQHMAGCAGSKCIVTINTDPDASIFKQSRFGIEADYNDVLPAFTEEVRKLLSG